MPRCVICGEALPAGARSCSVCGSSQPEETVPTAAVVTPPPRQPTSMRTGPVAPGSFICPACGQVYAPDYADPFCTCGVELVLAAEPVPETASQQPAAAPPRPAPGTPCLALIGPNKTTIRYFPLTKDAVLIGRLDAVDGNFPEVDVTEWLEPALARKVSRKHALVLRSRKTGAFCLRPLAGNTGTQVEADMVPPLADVPLQPGTRIILGGTVRLRFEIA